MEHLSQTLTTIQSMQKPDHLIGSDRSCQKVRKWVSGGLATQGEEREKVLSAANVGSMIYWLEIRSSEMRRDTWTWTQKVVSDRLTEWKEQNLVRPDNASSSAFSSEKLTELWITGCCFTNSISINLLSLIFPCTLFPKGMKKISTFCFLCV